MGPALPATFAYIGGGAHRAVVALYRNRHLVGVRTLVGTEVTHDGAGEGADDDSATPMTDGASRRSIAIGPQPWWLRFAGRCCRSRAPLDDPLPCVVAGDGPIFDAVIAALTARTDLAVQRLEDAPMRNLPVPVRAQLAAFASPLGLALREVAPDGALASTSGRVSSPITRAGRTAARTAAQRHTGRRRGRPVPDACVHGLPPAGDASGGRRRGDLQRVRADAARCTARARSKAQIQAEIDAAQRKLQMLGGLVAAGGVTAIDVLRTITNAVPDTIKMDTDEYVMDTDGVRMKVKTDSFESVDAIKQQLLNTHYFGDVQVKDVKTAADGKVDFRLVLALSKAGEGPKQ